MAILAGQLRTPITIESATTAADAMGQTTPTWSTYWSTRGAVQTQSAREALSAGQARPTGSVVIRTRYKSGVTTAMRVKIGSRVLNIGGVVNVGEANRELMLHCTEVG